MTWYNIFTYKNINLQPSTKKRPQRAAANKKRQHSEEEDEEDEDDEDNEGEEDEDEDSDSDSPSKSKKKRRSKKDEDEDEDSDNSFNESSGVPPKDYTVSWFNYFKFIIYCFICIYINVFYYFTAVRSIRCS